MDWPSATDDERLPGAPGHQRDRRREKPQLSCTYCRRRKIRCDRRIPCGTCDGKGIGLSCTYTPAVPTKAGAPSSVGEHIRELEALVRSLSRQHQEQQTPQTATVIAPGGPSPGSAANSFPSIPGEPASPTPSSLSRVQGLGLGQTSRNETSSSNKTRTGSMPATVPSSTIETGSVSQFNLSPTPSDHGSTPRSYSYGAKYVNSVHWAAVLDSISELKNHYEREEEARMLATNEDVPASISLSPRLLYWPVHATKADILALIPPRPVVDRLVARYFNAQGVVPSIIHSSQFLLEYESFWQDQTAASFAWIGLLFSIMCLVLRDSLLEEPAGVDITLQQRIKLFHEQTVQCLVLGRFTKGGPHVLETMMNHCATEVYLRKDADTGTWLLLGMIVQLAVSMGYHRDPVIYPHISTPLEAEMRRRVWVAITQMDFRLSSQMGLPRLLRAQFYDTAEPRNLLDSDFDETTAELPPSRPETDVTPVLSVLARNRIDKIGGQVSDLVSDTEDHSYEEIMAMDQKLRAADATLPPIFRWQPLNQSLTVPPKIVLSRIWLQLSIQRLVIWLHRKFLGPSHPQAYYGYSRKACLEAAIKILEFQRLLDDEMQPLGQLYSVRTMQSPLIQSPFLLGMSVLCYYLELARTTPDVPLDETTRAHIQGLLQDTYPMWLRSSNVSCDAREAARHVGTLLARLRGRQQQEPEVRLYPEPENHANPDHDVDILPAVGFDQVAWDTYQEFMTDFPGAFVTEFPSAVNTPVPPSTADMSMNESLFANSDTTMSN